MDCCYLIIYNIYRSESVLQYMRTNYLSNDTLVLRNLINPAINYVLTHTLFNYARPLYEH
jgi:hypothetical protein